MLLQHGHIRVIQLVVIIITIIIALGSSSQDLFPSVNQSHHSLEFSLDLRCGVTCTSGWMWQLPIGGKHLWTASQPGVTGIRSVLSYIFAIWIVCWRAHFGLHSCSRFSSVFILNASLPTVTCQPKMWKRTINWSHSWVAGMIGCSVYGVVSRCIR